MTALALKLLLGGWGWIKSAFAWVFSDIRHVLIIALGIVALWGWHEHSGKLKCQANDAAYRAQVAQASKDNAAAQKAVNAQQKQTFNGSAEKTNAVYPVAYKAAHNAAAAYRAANRVRPAPTDSVGPAAAPESHPAGVPETAPADAELVAVTGADIDACTTDYVNVKAAYDWGQDLVAKGVAEFGD